MTYPHLLITTDGPIATVTLNRADKHNALVLNVMQELTVALRAIDATTAADWGLINRAVPIDRLEAVTLDLIQRATRGLRCRGSCRVATLLPESQVPFCELLAAASASASRLARARMFSASTPSENAMAA